MDSSGEKLDLPDWVKLIMKYMKDKKGSNKQDVFDSSKFV